MTSLTLAWYGRQVVDFHAILTPGQIYVEINNLAATSALKGAMWVHTRIRNSRSLPARASVAATDLRWPELSMPGS